MHIDFSLFELNKYLYEQVMWRSDVMIALADNVWSFFHTTVNSPYLDIEGTIE